MSLISKATALLNQSLTLRNTEQATAYRIASRAIQNANAVLKAETQLEKAAIKVGEANSIATPLTPEQ